jgi:hypothetical protein
VETTCGHKGCTQHIKKTNTKRVLYSLYRNDKTLQKAGDKATTNGTPVACMRGWHGFFLRDLTQWVDLDCWRQDKHSVWKVKLSGQVGADRKKVFGQNIEMIEEILYDSPEGKKLRADHAKAQKKANDLAKKQAAKRAAKQRALQKKQKEKEAKRRKRYKEYRKEHAAILQTFKNSEKRLVNKYGRPLVYGCYNY